MIVPVSRLLSHTRPINAKFILAALLEANDPYWRPIKYSLFPPLGLATLAAYLSPDDRAVIVDEHVEALSLDDTPDLVVIQVYITNAYRAYRIADHYRSLGAFVCLGGLHVTSLPDEAAIHADAIFLGPGEQTFPQTGASPSSSSRPHQAQLLSGAEFHRRDAWMPPALRFLLQGRILSGWPWLLHAAGRRRTRRDRPPARTPSLFSRRSSAWRPALCRIAL